MKSKLAILVADGVLIWCLFHIDVLTGISRVISPVCLLRGSTGLFCPTCYGTRTVISLFQGDIIGALSGNAYVLLLGLYGLFLALLCNGAYLFENASCKKLLLKAVNYRIIVTLFIIGIAYALYLNLIYYFG